MVRIRLGDLIEKGNLKMAGHIDRDLPQWLGIDDLSFEFPVLIDAAMVTHIGKLELMPEITLDLWESVEKAMSERPVGQLTIRNWGTDDEPYYQIEAIKIEYGLPEQQPKTTIVYQEGEQPADFVPASESPTGRATWTRPSQERIDDESESQSVSSSNLEQDKWGYIDKTGQIVIKPQFDNAENFSEGLARVKVGDKYGYIDKTGQIVIKPQFDRAGNFSEGLAEVKVGDKYGYIDKTGQVVITPQFDDTHPFSEGLAQVKVGDKCSYIDKMGRVVIAPQFDTAWRFSDGLAYVIIGGKYGYIDKTGRVVIAPQFNNIVGEFSNGLAYVKIGGEFGWTSKPDGGKYGYIDKTGQMVIAPQFDTAWRFSDGLAYVKIGDKYGYIDKTGRVVITPQFSSAGSFSEGLAWVLGIWRNVGCKYGCIDKTGRVVIAPQFDIAYSSHEGLASFHEGLSAVIIDYKYGYIDKTGRVVIAPLFDYAGEFSEGLASVKIGGKQDTSHGTQRPSETKSGGCFLATAVYGSEVAPEVITLRDFRDNVLLSSRLGGVLVGLYYLLSPPVARVLSVNPILRNMVRKAFVQPIISLVRSKFHINRKEGE